MKFLLLLPVVLMGIYHIVSPKAALKPRTCGNAPYVAVQQDTSYVSTPVIIPQQLLQDKINNALRKDIIRDEDFENVNKVGKKDRMKLWVNRLDDIKITWNNQVATCNVPLQVMLKKQLIGQKLVPLNLNLDFDMDLTFDVAFDIDSDWRLVTTTTFRSFQWLKTPALLGGTINVKDMVEKRLLKQMPEIETAIDEQIYDKVRLDNAIGRIWQKLQKPIALNKQKRLLWLQFQPVRFEIGKISTNNKDLLIQSRVVTFMQTLVGKEPEYDVNKVLPPLQRVKSLPDTAYIHLIAELPYSDLNEVLADQLAGKTFNIKGQKVKVREANVFGCGDQLVARLRTRGAYKGDLYIHGKPEYQRDSQLVIRNFDFEMETEEALLNGADWLLHSTFQNEIQDMLALPLKDKIAQLPKKIVEGIEKGKAGKKLDLDIEQWNFEPQQIWVQDDHLKVSLMAFAQVRLELEKL